VTNSKRQEKCVQENLGQVKQTERTNSGAEGGPIQVYQKVYGVSISMTFLALLTSFRFILCWDLKKLADEVNSQPGVTWVAGVNPWFEHMTEEEFRALNQAKSNPSSNSEVSREENDDITFPEEFDGRKRWPFCPTIGFVYDQGHCGSCWAMCAFEVLQDRFCIHSDGVKQLWLSGQDLTSCSMQNGCKGFLPLL
jgi:hypothetical protein